MINVTPSFLAAAVSGDQYMVTEAEIWTDPTHSGGAQYLASLGTVTAGSVTEDESQEIRRTCQVTIASQGLSHDQLVPVKQGDLLHPLSRNELRLFRGFAYPNNTVELAPLGVFRMSKPVVADTGSSLTVQINGNDRSMRVTQSGWVNPYTIPNNTPIDAAIRAALDSRFPGLQYNLIPSGFLLPATNFGTQVGTGQNDPWLDMQNLAISGGYELFFDAMGIVTLRVVPDPVSSPPSGLMFSADIGAVNPVTMQVGKTIDETQTFNGVVASSTASNLATPIQQTVWVTDPTSPVFPQTFGYFPSFYQSPLINSAAQAVAAAHAKLQKLLTALDETTFTAVPNPALNAGDIIQVTDTRIGTNNYYAASQIVMPLDPGTAMQVTCRARRTAA